MGNEREVKERIQAREKRVEIGEVETGRAESGNGVKNFQTSRQREQKQEA